MPTIRKKVKVTHHLPDGKRVPAGTPGATPRRTVSDKWYGFGLPHLPPDKAVPLARDKAAARRQLDELVRQAERGQAGVPDHKAGRLPLADALESFARDAAAGLASRGRRRDRPAPKQVKILVQRVADLLDGCGFATAADLNPAAPGKLNAYLTGRLGKPRHGVNRRGFDVHAGGISHQTADFYLLAARRFVWWLHHRRRLPVDQDLFNDLAGFDPASNRVHPRRAATVAELEKLLAATAAGRRHHGLDPGQRVALYLAAVVTGLRAEELAAITPVNLQLDADPPLVVLPARDTKSGRAARQPIPGWAADALRRELSQLRAGDRLWPGNWPREAAEMLAVDLKRAGVPYLLDDGTGPAYLDFHALRHTYVTMLADSGAGPKELQVLARHLDPRLTLKVYTHARGDRLAAAAERLPVIRDAGLDAARDAGAATTNPNKPELTRPHAPRSRRRFARK